MEKQDSQGQWRIELDAVKRFYQEKSHLQYTPAMENTGKIMRSELCTGREILRSGTLQAWYYHIERVSHEVGVISC